MASWATCRFPFAYKLPFTLAIVFAGCQKPNNTINDEKINSPIAATQPKTTGNKDSLFNKIALFLTFDDGPNWGSESVNKEATMDSVYITAFVVGKFVFRTDDNARLFNLYKHNAFIEIGNHSFTHANSHYHSYYRHTGEVLKDFLMNHDTLHLSGNIARLPGRNCWRIGALKRDDLEDGALAADTLAWAGYRVFGWDMEWRYDSAGKIIESAEDMVHKVEVMTNHQSSFLPGNIVILCHDPMLLDTGNIRPLREFVQQMKKSGKYKFEPLTKYPHE